MHHHNTERSWATTSWYYCALCCHAARLWHSIFHKVFPQTGRAEGDVERLSWATSHDVAVKVAVITRFRQPPAVLTERADFTLAMTSPLEVVSSLCWGQASVLTQLPTHLCLLQGWLAVGWYMHTHEDKYSQIHSYLQCKHTFFYVQYCISCAHEHTVKAVYWVLLSTKLTTLAYTLCSLSKVKALQH